MSKQLTRRAFLGTASAVPALAVPVAGMAGPAAHPARAPNAPAATVARGAEETPMYLFFNPQELAFIEAACERLIPADDIGPGALQAWVPNYLDKQLGGAWGAGERLYRSGPWQPGSPSQGYQLPFTPAELFHTALRAIDAEFSAKPATFGELAAEQQDAYLKELEAGGKDLGGVPSEIFFAMLLQMTVEGYLSDPVYGGNKNMAAWKMLGFPGAYANYYDAISNHGVKFERAPMSIGEDGRGQVHPDPNIPAAL